MNTKIFTFLILFFSGFHLSYGRYFYKQYRPNLYFG